MITAKRNHKRNRLILAGFIAAFLVLGIYLIYRIYSQKPDYVIVRIKGSPGNWWWVTPRPPDWLANSVHAGDKEFNALGQPTAEVLLVNIYDAGGTTRDVYITARLAARKNARTNKYRYKGESLEIGGPIVLQLNKSFFPGMVTEIYPGETIPPRNTVTKIVKAVTYDRWPWEADGLKVGDKMTDGTDHAIAEILAIDKRPAEKEGFTSNGTITKALSPFKEDFILTIRIEAEKRQGELVFREEQYVKIGNFLWIQFPNYNLSQAQIMSIQDDRPQP